MKMSMEVNPKDLERLMKKLDYQKRDDVIRESLYQSVIYLSGWIKDRRLSGPRPQFLGVDTGRLRASITGSRTEKIMDTYQAKVGTNVVYGRIHEFGGPIRGGQMPARPFMRPAVADKENQQNVTDNLRRNITEQLES